MKRHASSPLKLIILLVLCLPILIGCGGGGGGGIFGGGVGDGFDPSAYTFKAITPANTPTLGSADIRALVQASNTPVLYAGTGNGLYVTDPTKSSWTFSSVAGLPAAQAVNALLFAKNGLLWVGTDSGLYTLNIVSGAVSAIASFTGEKVTALAEQGTGIYWVGLATTSASTTAIARSENGTSFTFYGKGDGMTASSVVKIYASADPTLVVACGIGQPTKSGLFQFKSTAQTPFVQMDDLKLNNGATLFTVVGDTYYAGGPGTGLLYQATRNGEWKALIADLTPYDMQFSVYGAGYRTWVGFNQSLQLTFNLSAFKTFSSTSGLASNTCNIVSQGSYGTFIGHSGVTGGISIAQLDAQ